MPRVLASQEASCIAHPCTDAPPASNTVNVAEQGDLEWRQRVLPDALQQVREMILAQDATATVEIGQDSAGRMYVDVSHPNASSTLSATRTGSRPWLPAKLCSQCVNTMKRGDEKGWCDTLTCAFIRGYELIEAWLRILSPFIVELQSDNSENAKHIVPLFIEAEQIATGLVWQLSGMIRWVTAVRISRRCSVALCNVQLASRSAVWYM